MSWILPCRTRVKEGSAGELRTRKERDIAGADAGEAKTQPARQSALRSGSAEGWDASRENACLCGHGRGAISLRIVGRKDSGLSLMR